MNQVNPNNNINSSNPFTKKEEIIKTEISNIDTNFKNNNASQTKENYKNISIEKGIKDNNFGYINNNNSKNNDNKLDNNKNEQDIDFKEKFNKLIEEIKLKEENKKGNNNNNSLKEEQNNNFNYNYQDNNLNKEKIINKKNIDEEILKSKKELEEIDKNLNLLAQRNRHKKELKYNKSENLLNSNININEINYINNRDSKKKYYNDNIYESKNIFNNNKKKEIDLLYMQKQIKKINKQNFDMNFKNIRNNKQEYYRHHISLRPSVNNEFKNDRSSLPLSNKPIINRPINKNENIQNNNRINDSNRYNIFINYKNVGNNNYYNNNIYNYNNKKYPKRNNYYFNNCNFINNNINDNNNNYKYNNLLNPYNNNYYNNYNQFYKDFINHLSLKKLKEENSNNNNKIENYNYINNKENKDNKDNNYNGNKLNVNYERPYIIKNNKFNNDIEINENNKRKVIYEKINFQKQGNKYEYSKGPSQVRYVGNGNYYNQCHKAIIRNPIIINPAKQFGIQKLLLSGGKQNKGGPRIILPKNMFA